MISIAVLHLVTLAFFTLGMTLLMLVTLSNALRLRNVEMSWKSGKLFGYPLFSTLFLLFTASLSAMAYAYDTGTAAVTLLCYNWIGVSWFVSSYLMSKRYVTDHGIVKNINDPSQTVAWSRIMDYMERNSGDNQTFVFFYPDYLPDEQTRNVRLELDVPANHRTAFARILQKKLGRRFSMGEFRIAGIGQLRQ
jgi:hypothetical protein